MNLVKIISSTITNGRRIIKFLKSGLHDVQTSYEISPYGIDSKPVKDMVALYGPTGQDGKTVIIGYININQMAEAGELRLFSTDENGQQKFYTWLKNNGTMELGGNTKHLTRFEELEQGFNTFRDDVNTFMNTYNIHTHTIPTGSSGTPSGPAVPTAASIAGAKINEIKTL